MPFSNIKETIGEIILELKEYAKAKQSLIELRATQKGTPYLAKTIYGALLVLIAFIIGSILLTAILLALSLIFVTQGTEAFATLSALTFSSVCLLVCFILLFTVLMGIRKRVTRNIENRILNKYLDTVEQKERGKEPANNAGDNSTSTTIISTGEEGTL